MELEVGAVMTGKVTGITKFGAFVAIANGKSGLVHISEIAHAYVDDVSKHLTIGQEVNVKVLSFDNSGRINLSIKQTLPLPECQPRNNQPRPMNDTQAQRQARQNVEPQVHKKVEVSFEDKLKRFMQDSDSKISGLYTEKRTSRRRR
ncbi:MAG: S1 RNA-binding domain-containing protein [Ruminococcaceae bacterium]|nr:S1 RNA-binding domain-containing protein [Oscillospiraceae bacterium]